MSKKLNERYYWLKLPRGFFGRHDIKTIEGMPNGKEYVLFYIKLLCESIDHNGYLRFSEEVPYTPEMLASITNTNTEIAKEAIKLFTHLGLLEIHEDETIYMVKLPKMIGSETGMAQYMREKRKAQDTLSLGLFDNVEITRKEFDELKMFYPKNYQPYIEKLSAHKKSTGKEYDSDYATLRKWLTKDIGDMEESWKE